MVILVLAVAACGDDAPADVAGDPAGVPDRPDRDDRRSASPPPPLQHQIQHRIQHRGVAAARVTRLHRWRARRRAAGLRHDRRRASTASNGEICDLCLWLADDPATRSLGLMQVTDLGGLDGMAFLYDSPHTTSFTMRNTVMPLSIAFFGADGAHLDEFDMEPCVAEPCPSYPTPADFVVAIEAPQGGLAELGIGDGSTLELLAEGCSGTSPTTP